MNNDIKVVCAIDTSEVTQNIKKFKNSSGGEYGSSYETETWYETEGSIKLHLKSNSLSVEDVQAFADEDGDSFFDLVIDRVRHILDAFDIEARDVYQENVSIKKSLNGEVFIEVLV